MIISSIGKNFYLVMTYIFILLVLALAIITFIENKKK